MNQCVMMSGCIAEQRAASTIPRYVGQATAAPIADADPSSSLNLSHPGQRDQGHKKSEWASSLAGPCSTWNIVESSSIRKCQEASGASCRFLAKRAGCLIIQSVHCVAGSRALTLPQSLTPPRQAPISVEGIAEESSIGRTPDSGSGYGGSNPPSSAIL